MGKQKFRLAEIETRWMGRGYCWALVQRPGQRFGIVLRGHKEKKRGLLEWAAKYQSPEIARPSACAVRKFYSDSPEMGEPPSTSGPNPAVDNRGLPRAYFCRLRHILPCHSTPSSSTSCLLRPNLCLVESSTRHTFATVPPGPICVCQVLPRHRLDIHSLHTKK